MIASYLNNSFLCKQPRGPIGVEKKPLREYRHRYIAGSRDALRLTESLVQLAGDFLR